MTRAPTPRIETPEAFAERFWSKVDRSGDCWLWTGTLDRWGYGQFKVRYATKRAHRVAWELAHGSPPGDLCVCHRCDNPRCVRPEHLFLGTHGDNARDRARKGRGKARAAPERARCAKLTWERVARLRELRATGATYASLGALFGVSEDSAREAALGLTWRNPNLKEGDTGR